MTLKEVAKRTGINRKTIGDYIKQGIVYPKSSINKNKLLTYDLTEIDVQRIMDIYSSNVDKMARHPTKLSNCWLAARERNLAENGQYTNRIGKSRLSA